MKLHYSPASPFARKVLVLLQETGQSEDVDLLEVNTAPFAVAESLIPANPLAKIPALERPDGPAVHDSRVICAFLDARAQARDGGAGLYGDGARRWDTLILESMADGIMESALSIVYEGRFRPEELQFPDWIEAQWSKVARGLDALNERWMSHLHGPLDMGQIAVGCALGYLDFRHAARDWRQGRDGLAAWYDGFADRPSMVDTAPAG